MGELRYSSTILDFGTGFTQGNSSQYPLDKRPGGPHSQSESYGEEKRIKKYPMKVD
jgi:hypothetical protein